MVERKISFWKQQDFFLSSCCRETRTNAIVKCSTKGRERCSCICVSRAPCMRNKSQAAFHHLLECRLQCGSFTDKVGFHFIEAFCIFSELSVYADLPYRFYFVLQAWIIQVIPRNRFLLPQIAQSLKSCKLLCKEGKMLEVMFECLKDTSSRNIITWKIWGSERPQ